MTISDRALAWLLGITLLLGGLTNYSPILHLLIRHGSLNLTEAHLHPEPQYLHRLPVTASGVAVNSSSAIREEFVLPQNASSSNESDRGQKRSDSTNHDHHGLPELLQLGTLDIAESEPPLVSALLGTTIEQDFSTSFSLASAFDPVIAPRPPPFRTGQI